MKNCTGTGRKNLYDLNGPRFGTPNGQTANGNRCDGARNGIGQTTNGTRHTSRPHSTRQKDGALFKSMCSEQADLNILSHTDASRVEPRDRQGYIPSLKSWTASKRFVENYRMLSPGLHRSHRPVAGKAVAQSEALNAVVDGRPSRAAKLGVLRK